MNATCTVEHHQPVTIPFKIINPTGKDPYLHMTGDLDAMIVTFRAVADSLERAGDALTDIYDLTLGDTITATVRPVASQVRVSAECRYVEETDG